MASKKSNIRPLWFVSPIVLDEDTTKPRVYVENGTQPQQDELAVQPAQPRRPARLGDIPEGFVPQKDSYGFALSRGQTVTTAWTSKEAALEHAKDLAGKTPKTAYGVFACVDVFETIQPEIIEKKFNDAGELILVKNQEKEHENQATD